MQLLRTTASALIMILEIAMLVRAVMSWFPFGEGRIGDFVYAVTEPFIVPVRALLERFEFVRNSPLDIPFSVTPRSLPAVPIISLSLPRF